MYIPLWFSALHIVYQMIINPLFCTVTVHAGRKMRVTVGGSVMLFLGLALLLSLVKGQCDNSCVHCCSDKKDEYDYPNPPDSDSMSFMLYKQLEQSLINDHLNLYKLRRVFFPSGKAKPIVVTVAYNINFHDIMH